MRTTSLGTTGPVSLARRTWAAERGQACLLGFPILSSNGRSQHPLRARLVWRCWLEC